MAQSDESQTPRDLREANCVTTNKNPADDPLILLTGLRGPWTRTELRLIQPLYDFGKISAGVAAAEAGVGALRQKQAGVAYEVDLNVNRAYWGLKLARELQAARAEGTG